MASGEIDQAAFGVICGGISAIKGCCDGGHALDLHVLMRRFCSSSTAPIRRVGAAFFGEDAIDVGASLHLPAQFERNCAVHLDPMLSGKVIQSF